MRVVAVGIVRVGLVRAQRRLGHDGRGCERERWHGRALLHLVLLVRRLAAARAGPARGRNGGELVARLGGARRRRVGVRVAVPVRVPAPAALLLAVVVPARPVVVVAAEDRHQQQVDHHARGGQDEHQPAVHGLRVRNAARGLDH